MHNTCSWRDNSEVPESLLSPAKQGVALAVALVLALYVARKSKGRTKHVHLDRVIDDQVGGNQWIDFLWVAMHASHGRTHSREIRNGGHAGKILQQDTRRQKRVLCF